jgi:hypothetical protein
MAAVRRRPSAKDSNAATAAVAAKATVEGNCCNEGDSIVDDGGDGGGAKVTVTALAAVRAERLQQL